MTDIELLTCTVSMMRSHIPMGHGTALIRLTNENIIGLDAPRGATVGFVFFVPEEHARAVNAAAVNLSKGTVQQPIKDGRQLAPTVEALDKVLAITGTTAETGAATPATSSTATSSTATGVTPTTILNVIRKSPYRIGGAVASATALLGPKWLRTPAILAALVFLGLELRASVRGQAV